MYFLNQTVSNKCFQNWFQTAGPVLALLLVSAATTAAAIGLSYLWWRFSESSRTRHAPRGGPDYRLRAPAPALPNWCGFIGGHTLMVKPSKLVDYLEGWAEEFQGDYELQLFGKRAIVVSGLADIRRMLTLRPSKFKRGLAEIKPQGKLRWAARQAEVTPSMFFIEGKEWGRSRRLISPHLSGHNVAPMLPFICKIGERMCANLEAKADAGEVVDAKDMFERFTHDIVALVAFGVDIDSTSAKKGQPCPSFDAMASATALLTELTMNPVSIFGWKFLSSVLPWVSRAKNHSRRLRDVVQGAIDSARRDAVQSGVSAAKVGDTGTDDTEGTLVGGTLLRKIIRNANSKDGSDRMTFSDHEVIHEVKSLFIAGTETTALTLSWSMYYLAKNPEAFARCRAEGLQVAPSSNGMVSTREQLSQLVFCSAVFREALRLRTPAPFLFVNNTEDYTMKNGFEFKKGNSFCLLLRAASISEENFTRGAEFVPERWIESERDEALLGKGAGSGERRALHTQEALLSFGAGPRVCPGQDMAKAEGCAVIAAICARFDVCLAPGQPDPPEEIMTFTMGPKTTNLVFTRRQA